MTSVETTTWTTVCSFSSLTRERGVAALIGTTQVAIFRTFDDELYALSNIDPFTGAAVLSRGIVGTRGKIPTVASPLLKQVFSLETGEYLEDPTVVVTSYPVRIVDGNVEIGVPAEAGAS
jgi:nitrite reductase (NADH) small subunit